MGLFMIILNGNDLRSKVIRELGVDDIRKASPQPRQFHKHIQLTFMIKGSLAWRFPDGKNIRITGGKYCITRHGDAVDNLYDAISPCSLMWIIFDPSVAASEESSLFSTEELRAIGKSLSAFSGSVFQMNHAMLFYLTEIRELVMKSSGQNISPADMQRIRVALCGVLLESSNATSEENSCPASLCDRVRRLLLKDPVKNLSVTDIAAAFKLSPDFFAKKFRSESGTSVADFVRRVKLEEAMRLMRDRSMNITETAFALGFSSSQYFATLFRKYYSCSPKQFKEKTSHKLFS